MEIVTTLLTITGALAGVFVGSRLSRHSTERDWLREKRAAAYLELLDLMLTINSTFAVGLRVSTLQAESAAESGHDFAGVEVAWHSQIDALEHIELRINMLGGKLTKVYREEVNDLMLMMMDAIQHPDITETEWDDIVAQSRDLVDELVKLAREDLNVSLKS